MPAADIVRGTTTGVSGGTTTSTFVAVTAPAGVVAGDQLIVTIVTRDGMTTWRAPAGWTLVARPAESNGEGFFYRAKYGTDVTGTSWTFDNGAGNVTQTKWAWSCVALKGDKVGAFLTGSGQVKAATSTALPTPTIAPAASCFLVAGGAVRITGTPTFTWPAGWIEQADVNAEPTATNNVALAMAVYDTTPAAAGSYTVTATSSVSTGIGWAGILAFAVAAPPAPIPAGTATGGWSFTGSAAGKRTPKANATGTWSSAGAGTGKRTPKGAGVGSWTFTGAASGKRTPRGSASGAWALTGGASGVTVRRGTAAGLHTWAGLAVGTAPPVALRGGTAAGSWTFVGAAAGRRQPKGAASGAFTFTGTATGTKPTVVARGGTASGMFTWVGVAAGRRRPISSASGTWRFDGAAAARTNKTSPGHIRIRVKPGWSRLLSARISGGAAITAHGSSLAVVATASSRTLSTTNRE